MAGFTCSLNCPATGDTITYTVNSNLVGWHLLDLVTGDPQQDIKRYRLPGTDGNCIIRSGQADRRILLTARYVGNFDDIKIIAETHKKLYAENAVDITDEAGQVFAGCNLVPGGFTQLRRTTVAGPLSTTGGTQNCCFFEVSYLFQQDAP